MVTAYRGRFAPSPTGALHLGSLLTAIGSFLHARQQQGRWLVRMEDIDTPRCIAGADQLILQTLQRFELFWDETVCYQSQRLAHYQQALTALENELFPCACTRKQTAGAIYSGRCRQGLATGESARAWRVRVSDKIVSFTDEIQGNFQQNLATEVGDFVLKRSDGLFAYQLVVVVDDALQQITHIVRGADLLDNTPRQIFLQGLLNYPTPKYTHLPILVDEQGRKLSKQNHAPAVNSTHPLPLVWQVLSVLGQQPPAFLKQGSLQQLWAWAIAHWDVRKIPTVLQLTSLSTFLQ